MNSMAGKWQLYLWKVAKRLFCVNRYIDDVFMTTNLAHEQIIVELEKAKTKDPNIGIIYSVASAVDFLDVAIENKDGQLKTSVFHKPAAEPCILPYLSDRPRNIHRNMVYGGLLRATRYSSNVEDFESGTTKIWTNFNNQWLSIDIY